MFCGRSFDQPAFNPFCADSLLFDPLRMVAMGGAHGWCRKFQAGGRAREFEHEVLIDVLETEDSIQIVADLPGATKETIQIEVEKAVLAISVSNPDAPTSAEPSAPPQSPVVDPADVAGPSSAPPPAQPSSPDAEQAPQGTPADDDSQRQRLLQERPQTFAKRIVELPEGADPLRAEASCTNGVLTITIPKDVPESKTRVPVA